MRSCRKYGHPYPDELSECPTCGRESKRRWDKANQDKIRARTKERRKSNPGPARARYRRWYERNRERIASENREKRAAEPSKYRERSRRWGEAHREEIREKRRNQYREQAALERARRRARYAANSEPDNDAARRWKAAHPQQCRASEHRRRARLKDGTSPGVTPREWREICDNYRDSDGIIRCAYCFRRCRPTREHVVPISKGGRDAPDNVVPACKPCNSSKRDRALGEWLGQVAA